MNLFPSWPIVPFFVGGGGVALRASQRRQLRARGRARARCCTRAVACDSAFASASSCASRDAATRSSTRTTLRAQQEISGGLVSILLSRRSLRGVPRFCSAAVARCSRSRGVRHREARTRRSCWPIQPWSTAAAAKPRRKKTTCWRIARASAGAARGSRRRVRMQLNRARRSAAVQCRREPACASWLGLLLARRVCARARARAAPRAPSMRPPPIFHESGGPLNMTVINPSVRAHELRSWTPSRCRPAGKPTWCPAPAWPSSTPPVAAARSTPSPAPPR